MANKLFTTNSNINELLRCLENNESIILELQKGATFAQAQRLVKSYALRNKLDIQNKGFRAIDNDDNVVKFLKITRI